MCFGLRLFAEEFELLLGRADGSEGSALGAAFEAGLVVLGADLSNYCGVNCSMRRCRAGLPPALFAGDLDDLLDAQFLADVSQYHEGGSDSRDLLAFLRHRRLGHLRTSLARVAAFVCGGLLSRLGGSLRDSGRRGRCGGDRRRLRASLRRGPLDVCQVGLRALTVQPLGRLDADLAAGDEVLGGPAAVRVLGVDTHGRLAVGNLGHVSLSDFDLVLLHLQVFGKRGWLAIAQLEQFAVIVVDHGVGALAVVEFELQALGHGIDVLFAVSLHAVLASVGHARREDRYFDVLAVPFAYGRGEVAELAFEIYSRDSHGSVLRLHGVMPTDTHEP